MKKILFLIHDLSVGGAEKVLVNLVNNMDKTKSGMQAMIPKTNEPATIVLLNFVKATKGILRRKE